MANEEHLEILGEGVTAWNAWRVENPDVRPDLTGGFLIQANLIQAQLLRSGWHLSRAGAGEYGVGENGAPEVGAVEVGTTEIGTAEVGLLSPLSLNLHKRQDRLLTRPEVRAWFARSYVLDVPRLELRIRWFCVLRLWFRRFFLASVNRVQQLGTPDDQRIRSLLVNLTLDQDVLPPNRINGRTATANPTNPTRTTRRTTASTRSASSSPTIRRGSFDSISSS